MDIEMLQKDEPSLCTHHSNDANHQAANLINWQQQFDQLSHGQFSGVINERHFSHIHIFREDTSHSLRQQCRVEDGGLWLGFSVNNKSCRINHEQTTSNQLLCRPGSRDFELLTPDDFSIYGLVLHPSFFTELAISTGDTLFDHDCDGLWLENLPENELQTFRHYLQLLLQPSAVRWSPHTHEIILQDAISELLSHSQQSPHAKVTSPQRQRIMARVMEYLSESRLKSPITINELCAAVHVSRRTLQYAFTQCYGISPKQFIQRARLNQVRRALLNSTAQQSITELALNYGFFHLSQFSQDYKALFGETPQQTQLRENKYSV